VSITTGDLVRRLEQERYLLERINQLLLAQRDAILENDIANLNETVSFLQQLLEEFAGVESKRRQAMEQLAEAMALSLQGLTLVELAASLPPTRQAELSRVGQEVRQLLESADRNNRLNSTLVEKSQLFVRRNLLWLKKLQAPVTTYTSDSKVNLQPTGKQIINEAV